MTRGLRWQPEHDDALKLCFLDKMSCSEAAAEISAKFRVDVSRNAVIGRAHRLGITPHIAPKGGRGRVKALPRAKKPIARVKLVPKRQAFKCEPHTGLRFAEVVPLHLALLDLAPEQCRWPYGDGPFTFCGCDAFTGGSYCEPHDGLSRRAN